MALGTCWLGMLAGLSVMAIGHNSNLFYAGSAIALAGSISLVIMKTRIRRATALTSSAPDDAITPAAGTG
jgi:hypothetical protein